MKRNLVAIQLSLLLPAALGFVTACSKHEEPAKAQTKESQPPWKISHNTNGETVVTLEREVIERIGLKVEPLGAKQLEPETAAFGRVLDPSALSTSMAEFIAARATADASQKEFERLKTLAEQNNASARALQSAAAAAQRDAAQAEAARQRFVAGWSKAIADRPDLAALINSLSSGQSALVRLDLPAGEVLKNDPLGARITTLASENASLAGAFLGAAAVVDPQTQSQGFLFLVKLQSARLVPGAALKGWLKFTGEPQSGVIVPLAAIVHAEGRTWAYVQTDEHEFTRKEIPASHPVEDGWFTQTAVASGDKVVVIGAQQLLSTEFKGQAEE